MPGIRWFAFAAAARAASRALAPVRLSKSSMKSSSSALSPMLHVTAPVLCSRGMPGSAGLLRANAMPVVPFGLVTVSSEVKREGRWVGWVGG